MAFFDYIDPFVFLIALGLGIFFTYIVKEPPHIVFKHPTPENIQNTVFKTKNGGCYKYKMEALPCPTEQGKIHEIPV